MLITPLPGVSSNNVLQNLRQLSDKVGNLWTGGGGHTAAERVLSYLEWAGEAANILGQQVSTGDVDKLVLTRRYEQIFSGVAALSSPGFERLANGLVSAELRERADVFSRAVKAIESKISMWSQSGAFVVFDSSVFIHHENKLEEIDFLQTVGLPDQVVHLLVPMAVVDELDQLKESNKDHVRWRARSSLATLDARLADPTTRGILRDRVLPLPGQGSDVTYEVTVELLLDPPGHVRLPNTDDEIIDRALAAESLADRKVTLVTFDTGQSTRARTAGLKVKKLNMPIVEPAKKK